MRRLVAIPGTLAFAAVLWGCGGDVKEEAPGVATGEVLAQAPPNAVGAGVGRPAEDPPVKAHPKSPAPGVTGRAGKPPLAEEPADPTPADPTPADPAPPLGGGKPQKGTDL